MEESVRPTLARVFRRFYPRYRQSHEVTRAQRKTAWSIQVCRTPALGGGDYACDRCPERHRFYHSCRNRHCPVCQGARSFAWLEARQGRLLPVPYFHVVFTIPAGLHGVFAWNRALLYDLLFSKSAGTLHTFAADRKWLGAQLGFFGVLHTWGQTLVFHPHIHFVVPQGGLDKEGRWVHPKRALDGKFLFPVCAVSQVFRGRLLAALEKLHQERRLRFPDPLTETRFPDTLRIAASKRWEVYAQRPFAGPESLLRYVSLYTHRAAIGSGRLVALEEKHVSFTYKEYRRGGVLEIMRLDGVEFVGRFLQHVLPSGFRRIRYYGFLASAAGREHLETVQAAWLSRLGVLLAALLQQVEREEENTGKEPGPWRCPRCGHPLRRIGCVDPAPWEDSS